MLELILIAFGLHIIVAGLVAWAIVAWRAYVEDGRKSTKPLDREPS